MFLSNKTISKYIQKGKIKVKGELHIESYGISLNLGDTILIPKENQIVDSKEKTEIKYDRHDLNKEPYILKPNEFVLGETKQCVKTDRDIITLIDGRSTYARAGLMIHLTAMVLNGIPFNDEVSVLEIKNVGNSKIVLYHGERVGVYLFAKLSEKITGKRESKYINQKEVTGPIF